MDPNYKGYLWLILGFLTLGTIHAIVSEMADVEKARIEASRPCKCEENKP